MTERFKRYLEREFRAIRPTQAAMEYREDMLTKLLEKEQDLRIKGMTDDDLIYDMCIDSLGDFRQTLIDFDQREIKINNAKRNALLGVVIAIIAVLTFVVAYLVTSFIVPNSWGKTWLILVGGAFAGIIGLFTLLTVKLFKNKKFFIGRLLIAGSLVLFSTFVFLILQILVHQPKSYLTFLVMVVLLLGVDAVVADITGSKIKLLGYAIFVEVFAVMLYVILGLTLGFWHPYWILCIAGIIIDVVMLGTVIGVKNAKKKKAEQAEVKKHDIDEEEEYYTMWKDR